MGVPSFFRWLSQRFPKIIVDVLEQGKLDENGNVIPEDTSQPNPNGTEYDNLYLDMNGIIHPCTHPEDKVFLNFSHLNQRKPAPKNFDEMMENIIEMIDRLFNMVRPRKLLYLAIDGVAPRAKMNQQRSRRFRAAKEAADKRAIEQKIQQELLEEGKIKELPEEKSNFDSNCITPGTEFMDKVATALRFYIATKIQTDPGWKNIVVILSDSNSPGEGEHKIMEYIRMSRSLPNYNPNTKHVVCGLDADLIMLGLATHEAHFSILREIVTMNNNNNCYVCGQPGHLASECTGKAAPEGPVKKKPYQFLHLFILREYLENLLKVDNLPFEFDLERAIDDWVFLCFFVGNDFLPHLPTLQIRENAIGILTNIYKKILPHNGYITEKGDVHLHKTRMLLREMADMEDSILRKRRERNKRIQRSKSNKNVEYNREETNLNEDNQRKNIDAAAKLKESLLKDIAKNNSSEMDSDTRNMLAAKQLQQKLISKRPLTPEDSETSPKKLKTSELGSSSPQLSPQSPQSPHSPQSPSSQKSDDEDDDQIKLGEDGWRERYYKAKFNVSLDDEDFFQKFGMYYLEGLVWVFRYYYVGCCSWKWYFPYHFAPFAAELYRVKIDKPLEFKLGEPFSPLEQLMGVLPTASSDLVPPVYRKLMTDDDSPIIDFYPTDFKIDMDGAKVAWLGVALLPFIDEVRLVSALAGLKNQLSEVEKKRNQTLHHLYYVHKDHPLGTTVKSLNAEEWRTIDIQPQKGIVVPGEISVHKDCYYSKAYPSPVTSMQSLEYCVVHSCWYKHPILPNARIQRGILEGAVFPPRVTNDQDFRDTREFRIQNHAANRMINHYTDSNQYKPMFNKSAPQHYHPYEQRDNRYRDNRDYRDNRYNRDNRDYRDQRDYRDRDNRQWRDGKNDRFQNRENTRDYQQRDNRYNRNANNYNYMDNNNTGGYDDSGYGQPQNRMNVPPVFVALPNFNAYPQQVQYLQPYPNSQTQFTPQMLFPQQVQIPPGQYQPFPDNQQLPNNQSYQQLPNNQSYPQYPDNQSYPQYSDNQSYHSPPQQSSHNTKPYSQNKNYRGKPRR